MAVRELTLQGRAHNGERSESGQPLQGRRRDTRDGSESGVESVGDSAIEQQEGAESTEEVCVRRDKIVCGV